MFQKAAEVLKDRGIPVSVIEGRTSSPVVRSLLFRDPEGNSIELCVRRKVS